MLTISQNRIPQQAATTHFGSRQAQPTALTAQPADQVQFGNANNVSIAKQIEDIWTERIATPSSGVTAEQSLTANTIESTFFPDGASRRFRAILNKMVEDGILETTPQQSESVDHIARSSLRYRLSPATLAKHGLD